ncbi:MAG: hypothetical protein AAF998_03700 [Bacteroidota bacterium]
MTTTAHRSYWLISVFLLAAGFTWAQPCARPTWTLDKTGPDSVLSVWNTPSIETSFTRVWAMQHPGYRQAPHKLHPVWPGESAAILPQAGLREGRYVAHPCGDSTRIIQEGDIREGKRNGTWTSYWPGGEIFQKIDFGTEDERTAYRDHYLSGRPWSEGELDRLGNRQGTWIQYDTAGRLRLEMAYRDGQPSGWARYLRVDQSPQKRIHFTGYHEKWDTLWTYYPDGQPEICRVGTEIRAAWDSSGTPTVRDGTGVYTGISPGPDYRGLWVVLPLKGGKRHGTVEAFRKTGERYTSALYERDSLRQETRYYPSGPKSMQYNIYTDSTAWQEWYPNGQMKRRTVSTHRDTLRHRLLWYKNGERKEVYDLRFDLEANRWMPDGEWRAWYKKWAPPLGTPLPAARADGNLAGLGPGGKSGE